MGRYLASCLMILTFCSFLNHPMPPPILMPSGITINEAGQLVLSWQGDLWLGEVGKSEQNTIPTEWKRLTSSVAIARDPIWHPAE